MKPSTELLLVALLFGAFFSLISWNANFFLHGVTIGAIVFLMRWVERVEARLGRAEGAAPPEVGVQR